MKGKIEVDKTNRKRYVLFFCKRVGEKILQQNQSFNKKIRLRQSPGSIARIRNRCILTGRGRAVSRKTQLSRSILRQKLSEGKIMGWTKTSW